MTTYISHYNHRAIALYRNLPVTALTIVSTMVAVVVASVTWQWERQRRDPLWCFLCQLSYRKLRVGDHHYHIPCVRWSFIQ